MISIIANGIVSSLCFLFRNLLLAVQPHRRVINGILWVLRTGAPWRDLPERYGKWSTVSGRFYAWQKSGLWQQILAQLQQQADAEGRINWEIHHVDGSVIRAHQHAAGAKRGHSTHQVN